MTTLQDMYQFIFNGAPGNKTLLYMFWLVFVGAACMWGAIQHTGEKDYQNDDKYDDLDIW